MRGFIETVPISDTYCDRLGAIERLPGGNLRFYLIVEQDDGSGAKEQVVVGKIVTHASAVPDAVMQMLLAAGGNVLRAIPLVPELVH